MKYILVCLMFISCGQKDKYRENYGTIEGADLIISSKHVGGYGRSQCLLCHNVSLNVHRRPGVNWQLADTVIAGAVTGGSAYCKTCHTGNGL